MPRPPSNQFSLPADTPAATDSSTPGIGDVTPPVPEDVATLYTAGRPVAAGPHLALPAGLEGFTFKKLLGRGGFGEVWLATDSSLQVDRAVKLLATEGCTPRNILGLVEEGRKMARLPRHANRVTVHALSNHGSNCFLVMEYVAGGPLSKQTSPDNPMSWERAARHVADVADALVDLHAMGILHRDVKPANILWDRERDEALLADYGLAAYLHQSGLGGTCGYLAPELRDGQASAKSDVFSLAATLFHLVTGRPPFSPRDLMTSLREAAQGLSHPVELLRGVPPAVEDVVLAGLDPEPRKRLDLAAFTARLRGAHLQGLGDRLLGLARRSAAGVELRVDVSAAREEELVFRPVSCTAQPIGRTRNMALVPEPAPVAAVRTGDLLRLEITADADGHLLILNLGSSGDLNVLFPNPQSPEGRVRAGVPQRLTVKLTPPAGTDRAAVIWTRQPNTLTPMEWRRRMEAGNEAEGAVRGVTRGMEFVLHEAQVQPHSEWVAEVVTIAHAPG